VGIKVDISFEGESLAGGLHVERKISRFGAFVLGSVRAIYERPTH
jgi:hypothetical protein